MVALILALVQNLGAGKPFPAADPGERAFSSACSLLGVIQLSGSTEPPGCYRHPVSCFCSLPPRVPRKSHDPVLGIWLHFPTGVFQMVGLILPFLH